VFNGRVAAFHIILMESNWIPIRSFIDSCGEHQAFNHFAGMVREDRCSDVRCRTDAIFADADRGLFCEPLQM
jgi:hypothetical protein